MDKPTWTPEFVQALHHDTCKLIYLNRKNSNFNPGIFDPNSTILKSESNYLQMISQDVSNFLNQQILVHIHVWEKTGELICSFIFDQWHSDLIEAESEVNGYLDNLIRKNIIFNIYPGMGYFFLKIASQVQLTPILQLEIENSMTMQPKLPFAELEIKAILNKVKTKSRLRLALILAHEFGKSENQWISPSNFVYQLWKIISLKGFNGLEILEECLFSKNCQKSNVIDLPISDPIKEIYNGLNLFNLSWSYIRNVNKWPENSKLLNIDHYQSGTIDIEEKNLLLEIELIMDTPFFESENDIELCIF